MRLQESRELRESDECVEPSSKAFDISSNTSYVE